MLAPGHLAAHPLPPGIVGALGLGGYQLLADVAGVGAGRLGSQAFLLVAPDPDPALPDAGTQISLHQQQAPRRARGAGVHAARRPARLPAPVRLPAGARAPGLRSKINVVNPATGAIARRSPRSIPGRPVRRRRRTPPGCWRPARALPPPVRRRTPQNPELMRQVLLALALRDESISGAEAAELADRALDSSRGDAALDPPAALEAAKAGRASSRAEPHRADRTWEVELAGLEPATSCMPCKRSPS